MERKLYDVRNFRCMTDNIRKKCDAMTTEKNETLDIIENKIRKIVLSTNRQYKLIDRITEIRILSQKLYDSFGIRITREYLISLALGNNRYYKLLQARKEITRIRDSTTSYIVENTANKRLSMIKNAITTMRKDLAKEIFIYDNTIRNKINKIFIEHNNNRLFGIRQAINNRKYKIRNYYKQYIKDNQDSTMTYKQYKEQYEYNRNKIRWLLHDRINNKKIIDYSDYDEDYLRQKYQQFVNAMFSED